MNDYETLRDILELAEVLNHERDNALEVKTYNDTTGRSVNVIFEFNTSLELVNVFVED